MIAMRSIGFLDIKNIGVDPKIKTIGVLWIDLSAKTCFRGGHFEFWILGGKRWSDVVVPAIFEISMVKYPLGQIVMLLSGSAHLK